MKLMRNDPKRHGICKYALVRLDKLSDSQIDVLSRSQSPKAELATIILNNLDLLEFGLPGEQDEFFAIKLKDVNAGKALAAYADWAAISGDDDLAQDVRELSNRSGSRSPFCKKPD